MTEINFSAWVTDGSDIPPAFLVRAKKLIYTFVAVEKLQALHNAGWKWCREKVLTGEEEALLQAAFPGLWPNPPTEFQVQDWLETYWEPRSHAAQTMRTICRHAITPGEFSYVDLDGLI